MREATVTYYKCVVCLKEVQDVYPLTENYVCFYQSLVSTISKMEPESCHFCYICAHLLKKFSRFTQKCLKAQQHLQNCVQETTKQNITLNNMVCSQITVYDSTDIEIDVKKEINDYTDDGYCNNDDNGLENANFDDTKSYEIKVDDNKDDDLPLKLLREQLSNSEIILFDQNQIAEDLIKIENEGNPLKKKLKDKDRKRRLKKNKRNKIQREGFSSRMKQETDEYLVIKLSKDQIREEMLERSKSERYSGYPYKCDQCVKGFNFADVLKNHMEYHNEKRGPLKCDICSQYCRNAISLRGHMKSHTTRYECKLCGVVRPARQHLLDHYYSIHRTLSAAFTCTQCEFTTNKRANIQRHVLMKHKISDNHTCELCGKIYRTIESFRVHMMRHHTDKKLRCTQCPCSFVYKSLLDKHVRDVHGDAQYYCVECDKRFKSDLSLKAHFTRSTKHKDPDTLPRLNCQHCNDTFTTASSLDTHLVKVHSAVKRHACSVCSRKYTTRIALSTHIRSRHEYNQFICDVCNKSCSKRYYLVRHMRTHTGEKPYACHCGASYSQSHQLRRHEAKHKKEVPPRDDVKTEIKDIVNFQQHFENKIEK